MRILSKLKTAALLNLSKSNLLEWFGTETHLLNDDNSLYSFLYDPKTKITTVLTAMEFSRLKATLDGEQLKPLSVTLLKEMIGDLTLFEINPDEEDILEVKMQLLDFLENATISQPSHNEFEVTSFNKTVRLNRTTFSFVYKLAEIVIPENIEAASLAS